MKRLSILVISALALFAFAACTLTITPITTYTNSTSTAAALISKVGYMGGISPGTANFPSSSAVPQTPNFAGSIYFSSATTSTSQSAYHLYGQAVIYNGSTYYLTGVINYSYSQSGSNFAAYFYSPAGITISGPDYSGTVTLDATGNFSVVYNSSTGTSMYSGSFTGYLNGQYLSTTLSFAL